MKWSLLAYECVQCKSVNEGNLLCGGIYRRKLYDFYIFKAQILHAETCGHIKERLQLQHKRGRLTTLRVSSEAENGEPQLQNKRGEYFILL
jgi:hypothetical protein